MLTLAAPAKLNLFLEVVGRRSDGYHDLESVFVAIDLADTLSATEAEPGETLLACDDASVPADGGNLAVRAAELLRRETGAAAGIRFRLEKRIPLGGGFGGGSSNAAAALRLANALWKTGLSTAELAELGARLGSDVPFFLYGGVCLCRGRGEVVTPLSEFPAAARFGVALTGMHSDTAAAFRGLRLPGDGAKRGVETFLRAMAAGEVEAMAVAAFNRFEDSVFARLPELGRVHRVLEQRLARPVRLTGSGSGLWFFRTEGEAAMGEAATDLPGVRLVPAAPLRLSHYDYPR